MCVALVGLVSRRLTQIVLFPAHRVLPDERRKGIIKIQAVRCLGYYVGYIVYLCSFQGTKIWWPGHPDYSDRCHGPPVPSVLKYPTREPQSPLPRHQKAAMQHATYYAEPPAALSAVSKLRLQTPIPCHTQGAPCDPFPASKRGCHDQGKMLCLHRSTLSYCCPGCCTGIGIICSGTCAICGMP